MEMYALSVFKRADDMDRGGTTDRYCIPAVLRSCACSCMWLCACLWLCVWVCVIRLCVRYVCQ